MITVPEGTKQIIDRSRYLSEAISKGIINHSSLARYIKPELETMLIKKVSTSSIVMALKRLEKNIKPKYFKEPIFRNAPEMLVRSGMFMLALKRTAETEEALAKLFLNRIKGRFSSISISTTEIQISGSTSLLEEIKENIEDKFYLLLITDVSQITIFLPGEAVKTSGVYYFFLKSLSWEGINLLSVSATKSEFTLFFSDLDINRAFEILTSLYQKK